MCSRRWVVPSPGSLPEPGTLRRSTRVPAGDGGSRRPPRAAHEQVLLHPGLQQDPVAHREAGHHACEVELRVLGPFPRRLLWALAGDGLEIHDPVTGGLRRDLAPHREEDERLSLRPTEWREPRHQGRDLVGAQVVEDVPGQEGVVALARFHGQQSFQEGSHRALGTVLRRLRRERSMQVDDPHATREPGQELDVAGQRRSEVEHRVAGAGP
jgi:hypothetical protein